MHRIRFSLEPAQAWRDNALCARTDPALFHPEEGQSASAAKTVCAVCPVRAECLEHALTRSEPDGVWGGLTVRERRALKRQTRAAA